MTTTPAIAGQPGGDDLTARIFRALYQEFDLRAINGTDVVVPKDAPWFAPHSLGDIARQISDYPGPAASPAGPGQIIATTSSAESSARSAAGGAGSYCKQSRARQGRVGSADPCCTRSFGILNQA